MFLKYFCEVVMLMTICLLVVGNESNITVVEGDGEDLIRKSWKQET